MGLRNATIDAESGCATAEAETESGKKFCVVRKTKKHNNEEAKGGGTKAEHDVVGLIVFFGRALIRDAVNAGVSRSGSRAVR